MLRCDGPCRAEECLWPCHRGCIESAAQCSAGATLDCVVGASHSRDRVEYDHDILPELDKASCALENHLGDVGVPNRGHVEARCDYLAVAPGDHLAHFLGTLVYE